MTVWPFCRKWARSSEQDSVLPLFGSWVWTQIRNQDPASRKMNQHVRFPLVEENIHSLDLKWQLLICSTVSVAGELPGEGSEEQTGWGGVGAVRCVLHDNPSFFYYYKASTAACRLFSSCGELVALRLPCRASHYADFAAVDRLRLAGFRSGARA